MLAGGTDLLVQCRAGVRRPTAFIDIKRIPELVDITVDAQGLRLGAATPAADICADEHLRQRWPGRSCRAHRIDADSGTGISRRQPVQCVARVRERVTIAPRSLAKGEFRLCPVWRRLREEGLPSYRQQPRDDVLERQLTVSPRTALTF